MNKEMEKYLKAVRRKLNMPKDAKDRVMADFVSSIQCRLEDGQTDREIISELGTPKTAAAELNEQMKEYTYVKSPWRWGCLALIVLCASILIHKGVRGFLAGNLTRLEAASVGIIGGADGPTAIFVTSSPDALLYVFGILLLLLIMGIMGFLALSKIKRK